MKREFPFQARVNGQVIMITGLHWSGGCYTTQGAGLLPLSVTPLEESLEPARIRAQSTDVEPEQPKAWKRQGFFKRAPVPLRERRLKANNARLWLMSTLHDGPKAAAEVLRLAARDGINEWSLRRAKKYHGIQAVRVGGLAWRGSWQWRFPPS